CTAKVVVPRSLDADAVISEGGVTVWRDRRFRSAASGVSEGEYSADGVVFTVGSGSYSFLVTWSGA
ncbi:MAG: hypothetical protein ABIF77_03785, partial [bacterium]